MAQQGSGEDGRGAGKARGRGKALNSVVQVERLIQLALMLPAATVIGWLIGVGLDRWLHQHWIYIVGLLLGAAAGFVQIFRVVLANTED
jgi:ATP synthase protein I